MILVEQHIIKKQHPFYKECDSLCFKSKNLYNQTLYNVRQHFFKHKQYLSPYQNYHITKEQEPYKALPTKISCQTINMVGNNFKSFFSLLKNKKNTPKIPSYLDKENGRYLVKFPKQALGKRIFDSTGKVFLSQTNIHITTKIKEWNDIKEVRIVPKAKFYVIEVVYEKPNFASYRPKKGSYAGLDIGLNNLATVAYNSKTAMPFCINGKPIKSINQYYNKKLASLKTELAALNSGQKSSNRIIKLTNKRNRKIKDYLHKTSRILVNQLVSNQIEHLVIGKNADMKQGINIGKRNNQNFVQAPVMRFIDMVKYKAELEDIKVELREESYTSKCSFLDGEPICKHSEYKGKRTKRGLFRSEKGILINADLNGAYNILKKAIPNAFAEGIEGLGVAPMVMASIS